MKILKVSGILAAILLVAAAIGSGVAEAGDTQKIGEFMEGQPSEQVLGETHSEQPVLRFEGMEVLPSAIDVAYGADGNPASDVAQARGTVETGSLPAERNKDSSIVAIDGVMYYWTGGKLYGPY